MARIRFEGVKPLTKKFGELKVGEVFAKSGDVLYLRTLDIYKDGVLYSNAVTLAGDTLAGVHQKFSDDFEVVPYQATLHVEPEKA